MTNFDPAKDPAAGIGPRSVRATIAALVLAMAFVILYIASPLFSGLGDSDTWRALGWERGQTGALDTLRGVVRQINRTQIDPAIIRHFFVGAVCAIAILSTKPFTPKTARRLMLGRVIDLGLLVLLGFALFVLGRKMGLGSDVLLTRRPPTFRAPPPG